VAASGRGHRPRDRLGLAAEGARVTICDVDSAVLEATAEEIRSATNAQVLAVPTDVTRYEEIQRLVRPDRRPLRRRGYPCDQRRRAAPGTVRQHD